MSRGKMIAIEGIDGSGKSTVFNACRSWAESNGHTYFDVVEFTKRERRLPQIEELGNATAIHTAEPTYAWIGAAIREEIIAKHDTEQVQRSYSGSETADAFALDRLVLYRRLIMPFLDGHPERIVLHDRGLASTLAYQPLQDPSLSVEDLLKRPGNAQAIAFPPTLLALLRVPAHIARERLANRTDKQDNHVFEEDDFQRKLSERFFSEEILGPFRRAGTIIVEIDGTLGVERVAENVKELLKKMLGNAG